MIEAVHCTGPQNLEIGHCRPSWAQRPLGHSEDLVPERPRPWTSNSASIVHFSIDIMHKLNLNSLLKAWSASQDQADSHSIIWGCVPELLVMLARRIW